MYKIWDPNDFKRTDKITKTLSGRTCQNWQKQRPHRHGQSAITKIRGRAGAIIDQYQLLTKYNDKISGRGYSGGGSAFSFECPSGIKSYKYNPWGWWGRYSNYGGVGYVKCEDGSRPRTKGVNRSYMYRAKRPYITNNVSKASRSRRYELGDHNYCRSLGSRGFMVLYNRSLELDGRDVVLMVKKYIVLKKKYILLKKHFNLI